MSTSAPPALPPETQQQRWLKYGGNVALATLVVLLLAVGVTYIAQSKGKRLDTTVAGVNSLRPQTISILRNLKGKVRLVSLYPTPSTDKLSGKYLDEAREQIRQTETISDLLAEYARVNKDVSVELVDPRRQRDKLDALTQEVTKKYGKELEPYKQFFEQFPGFTKQFDAFSAAQSDTAAKIANVRVSDPDTQDLLAAIQPSIQSYQSGLKDAEDSIKPLLDQSIPDYHGAAAQITTALAKADALLTTLIERYKAFDAKSPPELQAFAKAAIPAYEAEEKLVKAQLDKTNGLKDLKLDALRQSIAAKTILVMGEEEMRVLPFSDVWQLPEDMSSFGNKGVAPRLRFAGEQQVSTALVSIGRKVKPRAIFVRSSGQPLATSMFSRAPYSYVAGRLKGADFEVLERDLSGQFAMQAMQQGMPSTGEATDEQMKDKDAIWICCDTDPAMGGGNPMMGGGMTPNPMAGKLKEHLTEGGSALVLFSPTADNLEVALKDYGIAARTDAVVIHEVSRDLAAPDSGDMMAQAEFIPHIFVSNKYGEHPLTKPVGGLRMLQFALCPVSFHAMQGVTGAPLLPVTRVVKTWGETDLSSIGGGPGGATKSPEFDAGKDIPNTEATPLFGGAAAEKGTSRLVALGALGAYSNQINAITDPELEKRGVLTQRFPGNGELFVNSVLWVSHNDTMLEISPQALEVSRIADMSDGALTFWRWGVLVFGIPGLVLLCGIVVYIARRD